MRLNKREGLRGIILPIWADNNKVHTSMRYQEKISRRHFKKKNVFSMPLLLFAVITPCLEYEKT